jgi:hypothetical protein
MDMFLDTVSAPESTSTARTRSPDELSQQVFKSNSGWLHYSIITTLQYTDMNTVFPTAFSSFTCRRVCHLKLTNYHKLPFPLTKSVQLISCCVSTMR